MASLSITTSAGTMAPRRRLVREVLLQIAVKQLLSLSYGPASDPHASAHIDAIMAQPGVDFMLSSLIQQMVVSRFNIKGMRCKPFPLAFDISIERISNGDVSVHFVCADESDPFATGTRLQQYRKERNKATRTKIALLALGSKTKAIDAASQGHGEEALYRLKGAWLRLFARYAAGTSVESGWKLRWTREPRTRYWAAQPELKHSGPRAIGPCNLLRNGLEWAQPARTRCEMETPACVIHHETWAERDAWLHEMFEFWHHVALVLLRYVSQYSRRRDSKLFTINRHADTVQWALENATHILFKYPSNWAVRRIQLDYAWGLLFRCIFVHNGNNPMAEKVAKPRELSLRYFEVAAQHAVKILGKRHPWTMECEYEVAWTDTKHFGLRMRARSLLKPLTHYLSFLQPRYEKEYFRLLKLEGCCLARSYKWPSASKAKVAYKFVAGWYKDRGMDLDNCRCDLQKLAAKVVGVETTYPRLRTEDVSVHAPWDGDVAMETWEMGKCGGIGVCKVCREMTEAELRVVLRYQYRT